MKANELMIGDWVLINGTPRKIQAIDGVDDEIMADDELYTLAEDRYHSEDKVEGVPLTSEILENNGFIEDNTNGLQSTYHLLVPAGIEKNIYTVQVTFYKKPICGVSTLFKCWGPYREGVNDIHLCNLHYVHEMQHALRLCGIEHEIIL